MYFFVSTRKKSKAKPGMIISDLFKNIARSESMILVKLLKQGLTTEFVMSIVINESLKQIVKTMILYS